MFTSYHMYAWVFIGNIRAPISCLYSDGFDMSCPATLPHNFLKFISIEVTMDLNLFIPNHSRNLTVMKPAPKIEEKRDQRLRNQPLRGGNLQYIT